MSDQPKYTVSQVYGGRKQLHRGYCPHCQHRVEFVAPSGGQPSWSFEERIASDDGQGPDEIRSHAFIMGICPDPACGKPTILYEIESSLDDVWNSESIEKRQVIYPAGSTRIRDEEEIPRELRELYEEAGRVEGLSANAAAFLARRLLERVLRSQLKKKGRLVDLIDEYLETRKPPAELHQLMHDVRQFGNIAGHPGESGDGEPLDVEPEEATYVLDVVGELLSHVYVRPARQERMRSRWQAKARGEVPAPTPPGGISTTTSKARPEDLKASDDDLPF